MIIEELYASGFLLNDKLLGPKVGMYKIYKFLKCLRNNRFRRST